MTRANALSAGTRENTLCTKTYDIEVLVPDCIIEYYVTSSRPHEKLWTSYVNLVISNGLKKKDGGREAYAKIDKK